MSTFTPTTEGVRNSYIYSAELHDGSLAAPKEVLGAEFDRWLTQHDAEVAAKAWDEGVIAAAEAIAEHHGTVSYIAPNNPYRAQPTEGDDHE